MLLRVMCIASTSMLKLLADRGVSAVLRTASTTSPAAYRPDMVLQWIFMVPDTSYIILCFAFRVLTEQCYWSCLLQIFEQYTLCSQTHSTPGKVHILPGVAA